MTATTTQLEQELTPIRTGAAIYPVADRAFLRITGTDATRWLNGMVTNNIKDLKPGEGNYNFLLNAQGRIQGDCNIYREPGDREPAFVLETAKSQIDAIHQHLDKFIIMDDVELAAIDHYNHAPVPAPISAEAFETDRILSGRPKFGTDIRDRDLPQETNQTQALNFNKGCYLGQEIVERIHARGQVNRLFTQFKLTGSLPTLPAPLEAASKPAGELTSAVQIGDEIYALGYARREALDMKQQLTYQGGIAEPIPASKLGTGKLESGNS